MTVKTLLFALLLTAVGLWAQTSPTAPVFQSLPPDAAGKAAVDTNRQEMLKRIRQRALESRTNTPPPGIAGSPAKPVPGTNAPAPAITGSPATPAPVTAVPAAPPAAPNLPRPLPAPKPESVAVPSVPAAAVTPAPAPVARPGSPAVPAAPTGTVTPMPAPLVTVPQPAAVPGLAAATNAPAEETIAPGMIDFRQADLNQVLDIYSLLVNRTILRPATLPAPTVTLKTQTLLTKKEAIQALDAVLALNGITMINVADKFVKALPEAQGNTAGARFHTNAAATLPELGQYITHVVQLKYAQPSQMVAVLQPFVKIPNAILAIDTSQILVLRDYAENVKRMLELIGQIDVAVPSEFVSEVIPIKYAKSSEIASALNSLSSGGGGAAIGGGSSGTTRSTRSTGAGRLGGTGGYPGQTTPGMVTPPGGAGTPTAAPGQSSFSQRLQNIIQRASVTGDIQVLGQTKIIADERTNSLLIYASKEDMKTIKEIVAKLDIVLAQVLIEAVILEVTLGDQFDFGVSYLQRVQKSGNWTGVGAINNKTILSANDFTGINGVTNSSGLLPSGFSYLMSFGGDLDVMVKAAASDNSTKILQRPRIQTSHNEPASLFVGENRPYPTSSYYGGGAYGGYSSIQQLQIGVQLDVTPLINPDGLVVMEIHQKIDSFLGNVTIANVGDVPVTSSKEASAKVSVRDHDTIILGGLIETDKNKNKSGVPFLMDIPLLGYLFRSSHTDELRKELIVLIRPTVLPTPEIAALTATAEKNRMPGVRQAEKELRDDYTQRLKKADKADAANPPRLPPNP